MNTSAQRHLDKAAQYVARGDEFYRKAGEEILAAQKADPTLSNREVGEWFGKSRDWVREIVKFVTTDENSRTTPFSGEGERVKASHAKVYATENPEALVGALDEESREQLQKALDQSHPATSLKAPAIGSEHPKYGLAAEAAGPLARIKKGHEDLAAIWEKYADASDEEREAVLNALALATAPTFSISMVSELR